MRNVLKISPDDSVAVALTPLKAGDAIEVDGKTSRCSMTFPPATRWPSTPCTKGSM